MSTLNLQELGEETKHPKEFSDNFTIMPTIAQLNERFRNIERFLFSRRIDGIGFNGEISFFKNKTENIRQGLNGLVTKYNKTITKSKNESVRTRSTIKRKNSNQSFGGRR
jgi:hypothetical protein